MALSYTIERELVTVLAEGSIDVEDIRTTFSRIRSECEGTSRVRILIVDRGSDFDPTATEVREFVEVWSNLFRRTTVRIALLVERELHYGLGRMATVFAEENELPFGVFRDESEALGWLEAPEPAT